MNLLIQAEGIGNSVLSELRDTDNLQDLVTQLSELLFEEFFDDGVLKNIPVIDGVRKLIKATGSYSDYLLTKKLITFLTNLSEIPQAQRRDQISKLTVDSNFQRHVGENLMLLLGRLNDMQKPQMLAYVWKAYLEGAIDADTLFRLSHAVESIHVEYLPTLRDVYLGETSTAGLSICLQGWRDGKLVLSPHDSSSSNPKVVSKLDWQKLQHLASAGLMSMDFGRGGGIGGRHAGLRFNDDGQTFARIVLQLPHRKTADAGNRACET